VSFCGRHGSAGLELTTRSAPGGTGQRQVRGLNFMTYKLVLKVLTESFGICRLDKGTPVPCWLTASKSFYAVVVTADEISIVCQDNLIPDGCLSEKNYRALKVQGPLDFSLTGVLASLLSPLAEAGIAVFAISTYDTDYILVKQDKLDRAIDVLSSLAAINQ
jgi:uncharacterized protein